MLLDQQIWGNNMKNNLFKLLLIILITCIFTLGLWFVFGNKKEGIKYGLDLQGGFEVLYEVKTINGKPLTKQQLTNTYKTMDRRVNVLGLSEPDISVEGKNRIRIKLAGVKNQDEARRILSKAANLTFRDVNDKLLMNSDVLASPAASVGQDDKGKPAVALKIKNKDQFFKVTTDVSKRKDANMIVIWLDFEEGKDKFQTSAYLCGTEASNCLSAATVSQGFASDVIIQGNFTSEEVNTLVELINSGSLSTKLTEISSKTVDATFGASALSKTLLASLIGIALIVIFMTLYYHLSGFVAGMTLIIYASITFMVFWLVGGVLTLPGIAGAVLGVAMAVDSSIITFERIKDELRSGKNLKLAFSNGTKYSFSAILDGNITALIIALIMFMFGESSIKGFATMLIITTIITMIIMVGITRFLVGQFVKNNYFDHRLNAFIGFNHKRKSAQKDYLIFKKYDLLKPRKLLYMISLIFLATGLSLIFIRGMNLGIDYLGGSSININFKDKISHQELVKDLTFLSIKKPEIENNKNSYFIKTTDTLDKKETYKIADYFKEKYDASTEIGVVSNIVKKDTTINAIKALLLALIAVIIYVSFRFSLNYAIGAIVALAHDIFFMIAIFSIFKLEVSLIFVAALLTIIGYSLNDTIVSFDRIRDNAENKKITSTHQLSEIVNQSIKQIFMRSLFTNLATLIPVICLLLIGADAIFNFNIAIVVGMAVGTYSSIFIANQIWFDLENKKLKKHRKFDQKP